MARKPAAPSSTTTTGGFSFENFRKNIVRYRVRCRFFKPFLMEPMDDDTLEGLRTKTSKPKRRDLTVQQEAEAKFYPDEEGRIGFPGINLLASLREGGTLTKYDAKRNISTKEETLLPGFLTIEEEFIPLHDGDGNHVGEVPWRPDKRKGNNPKDGVAVCIVRPRFEAGTGFDVTIQVNEGEINLNRIQELFAKAGAYKGLGGFRKKGDFGRYEVVTWEKVEEKTVSEAAAG
ncbi:MAG: hypothetical protein HY459_01145 [Parcubacteria group bacterium]|nr:hypothetical protein [Parcubacteria group bacterium]